MLLTIASLHASCSVLMKTRPEGESDKRTFSFTTRTSRGDFLVLFCCKFVELRFSQSYTGGDDGGGVIVRASAKYHVSVITSKSRVTDVGRGVIFTKSSDRTKKRQILRVAVLENNNTKESEDYRTRASDELFCVE